MLSVSTANQYFAPGFTLHKKKVLLCDKISLNQIVILYPIFS